MAQINSSLLVLATVAIVLPAAFHFVVSGQLTDPAEKSAILHMSHAVSSPRIENVMTLLIYNLDLQAAIILISRRLSLCLGKLSYELWICSLCVSPAIPVDLTCGDI